MEAEYKRLAVRSPCADVSPLRSSNNGVPETEKGLGVMTNATISRITRRGSLCGSC